MSVENVENPFKNRLSFEFDRLGRRFIHDVFEIKDHISCTSKIFHLPDLKIDNMHDLIEEGTPSIYSTVSWLEEHLILREDVEFFKAKGVSPLYFLDDLIDFWIKLYFYDGIVGDCIDEKIMVSIRFKFKDLTTRKNILTEIKLRINEELKEKSRVLDFFDTSFVKIEIAYIIHHPPDVAEKMMEANYEEKQRYR